MAIKKRVTLRQIAKKVGVHYSTVALALKNNPNVKPATRDKIQAVAKRMSYVPDPMLSALCAYRTSTRPASYHETLAWITKWPSRQGWHHQVFLKMFAGARIRAQSLGYRLEEFWLSEPGMTTKRACRILSSRGIRGLLICPLPGRRGHLSLDWGQFSTVAFGYTLARPEMHVVASAHFQNLNIAVRRLKSLGHRRIGWVNWKSHDERLDKMWVAGFWAAVQELPESRKIPILSVEPLTEALFLDWYERNRPHAILTTEVGGLQAVDWLRAAGVRVPEEVSVASINLQGPDLGLSGIIEPSELIGSAAVDHLVGMIQRGETGVPLAAFRLLVKGAWMEGATVVRRLREKIAA